VLFIFRKVRSEFGEIEADAVPNAKPWNLFVAVKEARCHAVAPGGFVRVDQRFGDGLRDWPDRPHVSLLGA
jgi:hypothetical protein